MDAEGPLVLGLSGIHRETLLKTEKQPKTGNVTQWFEHLPNMCKTLDFILSTTHIHMSLNETYGLSKERAYYQIPESGEGSYRTI